MATEESRGYAKNAIELIFYNHNEYLTKDKSDRQVLRDMMLAANLSGRAINISKTTAAHAMSYGITSMFGIPHGFAVAVCLAPIWRLMEKKQLYNDSLTAIITPDMFEDLTKMYGINLCCNCTDEQLEKLCRTVNAERMHNNPVYFDLQDVAYIYKTLFSFAN